MKSFLRTMGLFVGIMGILGSFVLGYFYGHTAIPYNNTLIVERDWWLTLGIVAGSLVSVLILFGILMGLAQILDNQEKLRRDLLRMHNEVFTSEDEFYE